VAATLNVLASAVVLDNTAAAMKPNKAVKRMVAAALSVLNVFTFFIVASGETMAFWVGTALMLGC